MHRANNIYLTVRKKTLLLSLSLSLQSGHKDRLWLVGGVSLIFLTSSALVLLAWLCKGNTDEHLNRNSDSSNNSFLHDNHNDLVKDLDANSRSLDNFECISAHDINNNSVRLLSRDSTVSLVARDDINNSLETSRGESRNSCDFLIIEQLSNEHQTGIIKNDSILEDKSNAAILLMDTGNETIEMKSFRSGNVGKLKNLEHDMNCVNFPSQQVQDQTIGYSRCFCFEHVDCRQPKPYSQIINLPQASNAAIICNAPNCATFELNSQGELTVTDESSSFIHEDSFATCDHMSQFNRNSPTTNHFLQPKRPFILQADHPLSIWTNCNTSPNSNTSSHSSSLATQQTWSSSNTNTRRAVRFLAHQFKDEYPEQSQSKPE